MNELEPHLQEHSSKTVELKKQFVNDYFQRNTN